MQAVEEEYQRMVKNDVWEPVDRNKVPNNAKMLTSTWAMKRKASDKFRERINARR